MTRLKPGSSGTGDSTASSRGYWTQVSYTLILVVTVTEYGLIQIYPCLSLLSLYLVLLQTDGRKLVLKSLNVRTTENDALMIVQQNRNAFVKKNGNCNERQLVKG